MEKKRIYKYDNIKFFLMLLVIAGHLVDYCGYKRSYEDYSSFLTIVYSFHMPAFIFISGLFHSGKNVLSKAFRYLAIGISMKAVIYVEKLIIFGSAELDLFNETGVPWYMYALAFFNSIMYAVKDVNKKLVLIISVIAALAVGYTAQPGDFLTLARVIVFFPVYLLGSMTDRDRLCETTKRKPFILLGAAVIIAWAVFVFTNYEVVAGLNPLFTGRNAYEKLYGYLTLYGALLRLLCYGIAYAMSFALFCLIPDKKLPLITEIGAKTVQLYFWHPLIIFVLMKTGVAAALSPYAWGRWIYVLLSVPIILLLSLKPFAFPTKQIIRYSKPEKS